MSEYDYARRLYEAYDALKALRHEAVKKGNYFVLTVDAAAHQLCPLMAALQGQPAGSAMKCEHNGHKSLR